MYNVPNDWRVFRHTKPECFRELNKWIFQWEETWWFSLCKMEVRKGVLSLYWLMVSYFSWPSKQPPALSILGLRALLWNCEGVGQLTEWTSVHAHLALGIFFLFVPVLCRCESQLPASHPWNGNQEWTTDTFFFRNARNYIVFSTLSSSVYAK